MGWARPAPSGEFRRRAAARLSNGRARLLRKLPPDPRTRSCRRGAQCDEPARVRFRFAHNRAAHRHRPRTCAQLRGQFSSRRVRLSDQMKREESASHQAENRERARTRETNERGQRDNAKHKIRRRRHDLPEGEFRSRPQRRLRPKAVAPSSGGSWSSCQRGSLCTSIKFFGRQSSARARPSSRRLSPPALPLA